ncbi:YlmC/YmxH family sporulation protein [Virgibacillus siamensis]|uniref:YlmC/YmxH family sporulation protein n=1 Tax=Virgibacillus siamensis TaxID=480071 RepID=UPI000986F3AF|nr:YlmC/YmxH family sporulation protein [Virgibacillus siamensis]
MIKLSELQIKEVIVISDGSRLGHISDLEIDANTGRVTALIIYMKEKKSGGLFGKPEEMEIPWNKIETIGSDVILIRNPGITALIEEQQFFE